MKTNDKIFLIPAEGLRVVDVDTGAVLPAKGAWVSPSAHWKRRLNDGDVQIGKPATGTSSKEK